MRKEQMHLGWIGFPERLEVLRGDLAVQRAGIAQHTFDTNTVESLYTCAEIQEADAAVGPMGILIDGAFG
jgi:hypothetical protein